MVPVRSGDGASAAQWVTVAQVTVAQVTSPSHGSGRARQVPREGG
jgi:hypothetical protein